MIAFFTVAMRHSSLGVAIVAIAGLLASAAAAQEACPCYIAGAIRAACTPISPDQRKWDRRRDDAVGYIGAELDCAGQTFRVWSVRKGPAVFARYCSRARPGAAVLTRELSGAQMEGCIDAVYGEAKRLGLF